MSLKLLLLKVVSAHSHCTYSVWNCLRQHFLPASIAYITYCVLTGMGGRRQQTRRKESGDQLSRKAALRPKFIANIDDRGCLSRQDVQDACSDSIEDLDGIKKNASFSSTNSELCTVALSSRSLKLSYITSILLQFMSIMRRPYGSISLHSCWFFYAKVPILSLIFVFYFHWFICFE